MFAYEKEGMGGGVKSCHKMEGMGGGEQTLPQNGRDVNREQNHHKLEEM